ncbi:MAG: hypothetical protein K5705_14535 [Oscillospiraceae bacterium]|nr:hypothetical protein [Oscillospiraceae bacterium]MCR4761457.1 hypothetical protein [Oscillospiraceae bacterium]
MAFQMIPAALPLGDDTPILLYVILGLVALGLVVTSVIMSKKSKEQNSGKDSSDRRGKE